MRPVTALWAVALVAGCGPPPDTPAIDRAAGAFGVRRALWVLRRIKD